MATATIVGPTALEVSGERLRQAFDAAQEYAPKCRANAAEPSDKISVERGCERPEAHVAYRRATVQRKRTRQAGRRRRQPPKRIACDGFGDSLQFPSAMPFHVEIGSLLAFHGDEKAKFGGPKRREAESPLTRPAFTQARTNRLHAAPIFWVQKCPFWPALMDISRIRRMPAAP